MQECPTDRRLFLRLASRYPPDSSGTASNARAIGAERAYHLQAARCRPPLFGDGVRGWGRPRRAHQTGGGKFHEEALDIGRSCPGSQRASGCRIPDSRPLLFRARLVGPQDAQQVLAHDFANVGVGIAHVDQSFDEHRILRNIFHSPRNHSGNPVEIRP